MVNFERLKTKEYFKFSVVKVVATANEWWSLTRGLKYSDLTWTLLVEYFGKLVAEERWLFLRGCRNWRFDCVSKFLEISHQNFPFHSTFLMTFTSQICNKFWIFWRLSQGNFHLTSFVAILKLFIIIGWMERIHAFILVFTSHSVSIAEATRQEGWKGRRG